MIHINKRIVIIVVITVLFGFGLLFISSWLPKGKFFSKLINQEKITIGFLCL
ncbi:MAG TPA: hypothetical protein VF385_01740 [Patescibacteria group bacterium]